MTYNYFSPHTGPAPVQPAAAPAPHLPPCTPEEALASVLSRFEVCGLTVVCGCDRVTSVPIEALIKRTGDIVLEKVIGKLKCRVCGQRPASIYLQGFPEGARRRGWALRLDEGGM